MSTTVADALARLEALGHERVRELNRKHGVGDAQFGVRLGDVRKLAKELRSDHELGLALWATGHFEGRLLAILLMTPKRLSSDELDRLVRSAGVAQVADWLQAYVVKDHADREALRRAWLADADPWAARAGWALTAGRVARSPEGLDLTALLDRLEAEMPGADPAVQWTMNNCLAGIGIHHADLRERAVAIGEAHGLYRDYPVPRGCTSPFAPIWIGEMVRRQA
jgi:3-methyladenine DNA glycosylase AlkD